MQKEFEPLIKALQKLESFKLIDMSVEPNWIHFKMNNEADLANLSNQIAEIKEQHPFSLLVLANQNEANDFSYQLIVEADDKLMAIKVLAKKINLILQLKGDDKKAKNKELGIPDLSLVTLRQIANELKQRHNLTFALVWIENNERENIAIEGSGNPTQLVGLLSRGTHMAIEWADKNIKFHQPPEED